MSCRPPSATAPATAGFDDEDQVWIEPAASLPKGALSELKRLGVQSVKAGGAARTTTVGSWLELLPLRPDPLPPDRPEQTPVLFDIAGPELAGLVNEILRLGNDRQAFRWLHADDDPNGRALLRVFGPPYYSLLRALDRQDKAAAPVAYVERAPRVWIELGHSHPLAARIKVPEGKVFLLRPPRHWTVLDDAPFRDVYEVLDFALPAAPVRLRDTEMRDRIRVPLSLRPGGTPEGAELWVLRDHAVEELNRFVQNADDQLVNRLRFAVARRGENEIVVVRVGHSKLPPPVLVLPGVGYRPYLKLPNLFVPCGRRLHPPLRRDQVRKLLADDPAQVVWLAPVSGPSEPPVLAGGATPPAADAGGSLKEIANAFTPELLPEDSFRPLVDWVDYVLDRDRTALDAWVQASRFDFEAFVCAEDGQPKKPPPPEKKQGTRSGSKSSREKRAEAREPKTGATEEVIDLPVTEDALAPVPAGPSAIELRRRALEEEFLQIEGGLDAPERARMWPELATLNAAQGILDDAALCWMNALWPQEPASAAQAARWFRAEAGSDRSWAAPAAGRKDHDVTGEDLDRLLKTVEPMAADLRALAALLVRSTVGSSPPPALAERLNPIGRFLEKHEHLLPARAVWLAWYHFARLSGGDVLALAHARDRLLERLFQHGLRPEQRPADVPALRRTAGRPAVPGGAAVVRRVTGRGQGVVGSNLVRRCRHRADGRLHRPDLRLRVARLGEADTAHDLLSQAGRVLVRKGDVHSFLHRAFEFRIRQAVDGKPHTGPLPDKLVEELDLMEKMPRYVVERLLERSRILEPDRAVDAYRHWTVRDDPLGKELVDIADLRDRQEVAVRVLRLLTPAQAATEYTAQRASCASGWTRRRASARTSRGICWRGGARL